MPVQPLPNDVTATPYLGPFVGGSIKRGRAGRQQFPLTLCEAKRGTGCRTRFGEIQLDVETETNALGLPGDTNLDRCSIDLDVEPKVYAPCSFGVKPERNCVEPVLALQNSRKILVLMK